MNTKQIRTELKTNSNNEAIDVLQAWQKSRNDTAEDTAEDKLIGSVVTGYLLGIGITTSKIRRIAFLTEAATAGVAASKLTTLPKDVARAVRQIGYTTMEFLNEFWSD